mgnify:CR=1 FL=1
MKLGDLVRFRGKNYGPGIKDQWVGLSGLISEVYDEETFAVLVKHPDDDLLSEVFAFKDDVEILAELTDEQLEQVVGGRSSESFERWRIETINKNGKPC